jgi:penicillin-binding protein 1A
VPFPTLNTPVRWALYFLLLVAGALLTGLALAGIVLILAYPQLPSVEVLTDYQPTVK